MAKVEIRETHLYSDWFMRLRDPDARARIFTRVASLANGNPGDVRPVGKGVSELRIDYGPGYRVYFVRRGMILIVILYGGDKSSQDRDIAHAKTLVKEIDNAH